MNCARSSRRTPHILHLITRPLILFITLITIWWLLWGENINDRVRTWGEEGTRGSRCLVPHLPASRPSLLQWHSPANTQAAALAPLPPHSEPGLGGKDQTPWSVGSPVLGGGGEGHRALGAFPRSQPQWRTGGRPVLQLKGWCLAMEKTSNIVLRSSGSQAGGGICPHALLLPIPPGCPRRAGASSARCFWGAAAGQGPVLSDGPAGSTRHGAPRLRPEHRHPARPSEAR